jgi:hypothetical protein
MITKRAVVGPKREKLDRTFLQIGLNIIRIQCANYEV